MVGYGRTPPHPRWPGNARIAVQFVLNYEEGAENNVLDGSAGSETFLSEMVPVEAFPNRHMSMESLYEYGSRAGLWRVLRVFERRGLPLTIFAVATALQRNPEAVSAFGELGHEIACHGLRWQSYQLVPPDIEREHMAQAVQILRDLTGQAPLGWYTGRDSPQTRQLVVEHGGFSYDSDSYADDLPYWVRVPAPGGVADHLVVPYTLDTNDMRFSSPAGFPSGEQFFTHLRDAFDCLYAEGRRAARRCCRWACTAGWWAGRRGRSRSNGFSIMCKLTTVCGSPNASTSPNIGAGFIRRAPNQTNRVVPHRV